MHESHGDLLVGGARLKHVRCELEQELPKTASHEWNLSGHFYLDPSQAELLQPERPYRLELEDGRAGQVVVSRFVVANDHEQILDFHPKPGRPNDDALGHA